jgi:superfamily I DNA/RNA helicase
LIYQFIAKGIPAKIEGREIGAGIKTLVKRWRSKTFDELLDKLDNHLLHEEQKLKARNELYKLQTIEDKVSCAKVIINRVIQKGLTGNPTDLVCSELDNIFGDKTNKSMITLSSIHKSKGLEWHNVFLINTGISPYAKLDWEIGQEYNLLYVAITRAQKTLTYVTLKSRKN